MKKLVFLFVFSIAGLSALACLNYYYSVDKEGHLQPLPDSLMEPFNKNFNKELNVSKLRKLEAKLKKEKHYMLLSDYAVCLMKLGKAQEAVNILSVLYRHYPTEYKIASNLGTA